MAKICDEAQPYLQEMMKDPFGNYLFQKIVDNVDEPTRTDLVTQVPTLALPCLALHCLAYPCLSLHCLAVPCGKIPLPPTEAKSRKMEMGF